MKEKKYIHRKVTNQSDFLTQLPYVTGVPLRTRIPCLSDRAAWHALRLKQTGLQIPDVKGPVWSRSSLGAVNGALRRAHGCLSCTPKVFYLPVWQDGMLRDGGLSSSFVSYLENVKTRIIRDTVALLLLLLTGLFAPRMRGEIFPILICT